jgi:S-adenosylmethionine/arginine decarboxylase-like enzyme
MIYEGRIGIGFQDTDVPHLRYYHGISFGGAEEKKKKTHPKQLSIQAEIRTRHLHNTSTYGNPPGLSTSILVAASLISCYTKPIRRIAALYVSTTDDEKKSA